MTLLDRIKNRFRNGNIVEKLIYINCFVFLGTLLTKVFQGLYVSEYNFIIEWFSLDAEINLLFTKPWSLFSYGFLHANFIHILMNLSVLYYIGNLFLEYFTQKQLLNFYFLGTLFGGILFVFSQNYFPLFNGKTATLVGASAGISAIFIGIATYIPNYQIKLRFIGFVKLSYLAAIWIGLDLLGLIGNNSGGHFAHLGGALFGFLFISKPKIKKSNLSKYFKNILKRNKKPLRTVYNSKKKRKTTSNTDLTQKQIDVILDKISKSGYDTLTKSEKEFLFKQGKN
ncbi:MAG: rhomboid family intramembrane serine protease [Polaribacter sp.]|jgi:membrane associated rhomboid family serine protease